MKRAARLLLGFILLSLLFLPAQSGRPAEVGKKLLTLQEVIQADRSSRRESPPCGGAPAASR